MLTEFSLTYTAIQFPIFLLVLLDSYHLLAGAEDGNRSPDICKWWVLPCKESSKLSSVLSPIFLLVFSPQTTLYSVLWRRVGSFCDFIRKIELVFCNIFVRITSVWANTQRESWLSSNDVAVNIMVPYTAVKSVRRTVKTLLPCFINSIPILIGKCFVVLKYSYSSFSGWFWILKAFYKEMKASHLSIISFMSV